MSVIELGRLPGFRVGSVGPLIISVFHETATVERLILLDRLQTALAAEHPRLYALNVVVGASIKNPPSSVRDLSAQLQAKFEGRTAGAATVLAVRGLAAVIAHGFLAALALVASSTPTQVFKTLPDATRWLQGLPDAPADFSRLETLAADVEAFIADERPA
jgi:hypothetical protein